MKDDLIIKKIREVFNSISDTEIEISINSKKHEIQQWDSIFHLSLVVELEDKFNISFSIEEMENLDSIQKIINKIYKHD